MANWVVVSLTPGSLHDYETAINTCWVPKQWEWDTPSE